MGVRRSAIEVLPGNQSDSGAREEQGGEQRRDTMKAKRKSGNTKGKSSGKRTVKDLPAHKAQSVKGGARTEGSFSSEEQSPPFKTTYPR